jgi:rhodanese-related sulfurtransferase
MEFMHDQQVLSPEVIPLDELRRRFQERDLAVVNVLPRAAWEENRILGSSSLPFAEIEKRAAQVLPDRHQEIVVYCGGPT